MSRTWEVSPYELEPIVHPNTAGAINKMASVLFTSPKGQIGIKCLAQERSGRLSVWVK